MLQPIVIYTTRPIRDGERQGVEYYFTDDAGLEQIQSAGKLIELRSYDTVFGIWKYFTADSEKIDLEHKDYLMTGVLSSFHAVREYYGWDKVLPVYVEVEGPLQALSVLHLHIDRRFQNDDLERCLEEIRNFIQGNQKI